MIKIDDLLGVPYKDRGRDLAGFDCYGLAIEVEKRFGFILDDIIYQDHDLKLSAEFAPTLNVYPIAAPRAAAIVEMEYGNEIHIGVCLNGREFIHMTRAGCRVNQIGIYKVRGFYGINTLF